MRVNVWLCDTQDANKWLVLSRRSLPTPDVEPKVHGDIRGVLRGDVVLGTLLIGHDTRRRVQQVGVPRRRHPNCLREHGADAVVHHTVWGPGGVIMRRPVPSVQSGPIRAIRTRRKSEAGGWDQGAAATPMPPLHVDLRRTLLRQS